MRGQALRKQAVRPHRRRAAPLNHPNPHPAGIQLGWVQLVSHEEQGRGVRATRVRNNPSVLAVGALEGAIKKIGHGHAGGGESGSGDMQKGSQCDRSRG